MTTDPVDPTLAVARDLRACVAGDCAKAPIARGYCAVHYARAKKLGEFDGIGPPRFDVQGRFWSKVDKTATCWLWTAAKFHDGYGSFPFNGKRRRAHRMAWEWLRGPIPDGLVVDHLCRVRNCVNPDHMELVTDRENVSRGIGPTAIAARRTRCVNGHLFTPENTIVEKRQRRCRTCTNDRARAKRRSLA